MTIQQKWLWLALAIVLASGAARAKTISGRVYCDIDSNGRYDPSDKPLAAVGITDGIHFVATDAQGNYTIDTQPDPVLVDGGTNTLSVSCPTGYRPSSHWFIHTDRIESDRSVDFPLVRQIQKLPFTFVHGTDCHVPRGGEEKLIGFRRDIKEMADRIGFCILTGDLVDLSDSHPFEQGKQQYDFFAEQTKDFPVPLYCVPGNHDIVGVRDKSPDRDTTHPSYAYGFYTRIVGPLRWSFDYAGVHFAGLDFNHKQNGTWQWGIPDSALRWLAEDLRRLPEATRIFLFVHAPEGQDRLPQILQKYKVERIFHGHDHRDRAWRIQDTQVLSSGSISQVFADRDRLEGYRIVHVGDDGIDSFYRPTGSEHAINLDYPRWNSQIKSGDILRGSFYDRHRKISKLTIRIGEDEKVVDFRRGPVCCRFQLPMESLPAAGSIDITVTVSDTEQSYSRTQSYQIRPQP